MVAVQSNAKYMDAKYLSICCSEQTRFHTKYVTFKLLTLQIHLKGNEQSQCFQ